MIIVTNTSVVAQIKMVTMNMQMISLKRVNCFLPSLYLKHTKQNSAGVSRLDAVVRTTRIHLRPLGRTVSDYDLQSLIPAPVEWSGMIQRLSPSLEWETRLMRIEGGSMILSTNGGRDLSNNMPAEIESTPLNAKMVCAVQARSEMNRKKVPPPLAERRLNVFQLRIRNTCHQVLLKIKS